MTESDFKPGIRFRCVWNDRSTYVVEVISVDPWRGVWRELTNHDEAKYKDKEFNWPTIQIFLKKECVLLSGGFGSGCATCNEPFPYEKPPANRPDGGTDCTRCKMMKGVFRHG